jgi:hypothetical protein
LATDPIGTLAYVAAYFISISFAITIAMVTSMIVLKHKVTMVGYSLLSFIQTILIFGLIGVYMDEDFYNMGRLLDFFMFHFQPLPDEVRYAGYEQQWKWNRNMADLRTQMYNGWIGMSSRYSAENLSKLMFLVAVFAILSMAVAWFHTIAHRYFNKSVFHKVTSYLFRIFVLSFWIRLFMSAYLFIALCAWYELRISNDNADNVGAYVVAWVCIFLLVAGVITAGVQWLLTYKHVKFEKMLWIDEWFRGLRPHFWARSYPSVYMARCLFFASSI